MVRSMEFSKHFATFYAALMQGIIISYMYGVCSEYQGYDLLLILSRDLFCFHQYVQYIVFCAIFYPEARCGIDILKYMIQTQLNNVSWLIRRIRRHPAMTTR